ncbi:MAG: hypothetical protein PHS14_10055 [Elusimicrobia bacterium]|nr:hypothetical protein [Elusimicrobiota bacterium]
MEENTPSSPSYLAKLKSSLSDPRALLLVALVLAVTAAGSAVYKKLYLKPILAMAELRYQSHMSLMRLYDLQMEYRRGHGAYANNLDALLATAPDGAQLRERLKASMDINTLAVIGDEDRFRLEANVLDPQRTSVKIRGPLGER